MHKSSLDNPPLNSPPTAASTTGQERSTQRRPIVSGPQQTQVIQTNVPIQAIRPNLQQVSSAQQNVMQPVNLSFSQNPDQMNIMQVIKHNPQQTQPIMSNSGTLALQNVAGIPISMANSARAPPVQPNSTQTQVVPLMNNSIYGSHTDTYRSMSASPSITARPIGMSPFENMANTPPIQHSFNSSIHHNSQQQNPLMLQSTRMTTPAVTNELPSSSNRPVHPSMPLNVNLQEQRTQPANQAPSPQILSASAPHQSMQRERSIQGTSTKPIPLIRPAESPRSIMDSQPLQTSTHTSTRNTARQDVSDGISQSILQNTQPLTVHSTVRTVQQTSGHNSHRGVQKGTSQGSSPSNNSKSTSTSQKTSHTHTSSRASHKSSHKSTHKITQSLLTPQELEAAEAVDAAHVLVMSSRQRVDQQRSVNMDHNIVSSINQYPELNGGGSIVNNNMNGIENNQRGIRFYGNNTPVDYSISNGINDEGILKEEIGLTPHNRGHKMKNRAAALDGGVRLRAPYGYQEELEPVDVPNGSRHHIIYRIHKADVENFTEFDGDPTDNPYKDIDIKEILSPLKRPEDAVRKSHCLNVLKSQHLDSLATSLREKIEQENNYRKKISRLMDILQGDDVMYQDLDFRLNPPPETVSTRVVKAEEVECGLSFGVLNVGLQGSDRSKGKLAQETKDQGLEILIQVRNQLQSQLESSNEILRSYIKIHEGLLNAIRRRNQVYSKLREIDKQRKIEERREADRRIDVYSGQGK
ncbi:2198_t:CDS:2 [Acaulospora colombiana]|uniref:2198_t:CDS:1 n=1 Tax=Acaulospora colombiana TaxID=27376 RepID=A0ACA9KSQ1_9GLOM|nr:2198_t:CDS:2 [Acaulospora colombiana]